MLRFSPAGALSLALLAPLYGQTPETSRETLVVTLPAPEVSAAKPENEPAWQPPPEAPEVAAKHGLMWKVSSAHNTVYLLGSIHLASRDFYPLPEHIEQAFRKSNVLVVEVDLNRLDQTKFQGLMAANGLYPREDSLWNHISPGTRQLVAGFCQERGMDAEVFARMKPWLAAIATTLMPASAMPQNLAPGIDKYFLDEAGDRMRIEPLESAEYQFRLLSGLPEVQQERSLRNAVKNAGQSAEDFQKLQSLWLEGDAAGLSSYLSTSMRDDPEYQKRVFADRNPRMADRAEQCLKSRDRCFVVVGAGHMVGKDGVVRLLENRGYKVEQLLQ
ncbi:MAG TPA: TraB/GumN family protein [Bryobacteraceae bacterium]|nr:TraB/GumN family protein [Bryobacteraceae bacterium]